MGTGGGYGYEVRPPAVGNGQSSSVMLDQKAHIATTERRVNKVSNSAPLTFPCVAVQMWTLMMYWKICPMAKSNAAPKR